MPVRQFPRKLLRLFPICVTSLVCAAVLAGQAATPEQEFIRQLLVRIDALEHRVQDLDARLRASAAATPGAPAPVVASAAAVQPAEQQAVAMEATPIEDHPGHSPHLDSNAYRNLSLNIRGFGDIGYSAEKLRGGANSYGLGQLDLFITSRLSEHFGVLVEAVFEHEGDNSTAIDIERMLFQIRQSEYLNVDFGRYHSSIGFYNAAYHHGTWFQTAIGRPQLFRFEDEGGLLPIHNVGITANGRIPSKGLNLGYIVEVGNGRAYRLGNSEPVQNVQDENRGKAVNLGLTARPSAIPGLRLGMSYYRDTLTPRLNQSIRQGIWAGYAVYNNGRAEMLNEFVAMRHELGGARTSIPGFYSQFAWRIGAFRPYFRYEWMNATGRDPVLQLSGRQGGKIQSAVGGIRYDFSEYAALKFQAGRETQDIYGRALRAALQLAFTF